MKKSVMIVDLNMREDQANRKFIANGSVERETLYLGGHCLPEDSGDVFDPIFEWIRLFFETHQKLQITLNFTYLNSSSIKQVAHLINFLNNYYDVSQKAVSVTWKYLEGDGDMKDQGDMYRDSSKFKFILEEEPDQE